MTNVRKRGLVASAAICCVMILALAVTCDAALFGLLRSKKASRVAPIVRQSLVVFSFDRDAESTMGMGDGLGQGIAEYLISTLSARYSGILFDERLSPIRRAKEDAAIKDTDIVGPYFTDKPKSDKLAKLLVAEFYITGSVESYTYDKAKQTVELILKADLVDAKSGKVTQELMVGGSATDSGQSMDEEELQSIAKGKAVEALAQKLLGTSPEDVVPVTPADSKGNK